MEKFLEFARGPLFTATFLFMVLALLRLVVLQIVDMVRARSRNQDFRMPWQRMFQDFAGWIVPSQNMVRQRPLFSIMSILFHIGLILVPIFYVAHIALWESGVGVSWPGFGKVWADFFTILTIVGGLYLLFARIFQQSTRFLSTPMDYFLLILLLIPFISGFMMVHPALLPAEYNTVFLVHVLASELIFVLLPFTKMAHAVLFPFDRMASDYYWNLATDGPRKVAQAVRGDNLKV